MHQPRYHEKSNGAFASIRISTISYGRSNTMLEFSAQDRWLSFFKGYLRNFLLSYSRKTITTVKSSDRPVILSPIEVKRFHIQLPRSNSLHSRRPGYESALNAASKVATSRTCTEPLRNLLSRLSSVLYTPYSILSIVHHALWCH